MTGSRIATGPAPFSADLAKELERMRTRLLDLSSRNPLLNYRHPQGSSLRIIDEVPSAIFDRLVLPGGSLLFEPLPELSRQQAAQLGVRLTASGDDQDRSRDDADGAQPLTGEAALHAWAHRYGINPSYELSPVVRAASDRDRDDKLQTLLLPGTLESRLQGIDRKAKSALAESGVNLLHLLFGFVEWPDGELGEPNPALRLAPLVLVPVILTREERADREAGRFRYSVARSTEDCSTNITFQEKCRQQFGMELRALAADEDLEAYFAHIERDLPPGWRLRRCVTLGRVSFGKTLMWRDLDPRYWREDRVADRGPFRQVLGNSSDVGPGHRPGLLDRVHGIDNDPESPCMVVEADPSQYSVLVEVTRGRNLVVEGPPGTGKSQTIVNLIANALLHGKRVLFVAAKVAALDVVYRRLRQAQLGEFCLALHSQKSRAALLQEMVEAQSLHGTAPAPKQHGELLERHGACGDALNAYVARLHQPSGSLGLTPFTVLWRARLLVGRFGREQQDALEHVSVPNSIAVSPSDLERGREVLERVGRAVTAAAAETDPALGHPWAGLATPTATHAEIEEVLGCTRRAHGAIERLEAIRATLRELIGADPGATPAALGANLAAAAALGPLAGAGDALIRALRDTGGEARLHAALERLEEVQQSWAKVPQGWRTPTVFGANGERLARQSVLRAAALAGCTSSYLDLIRRTDEVARLAEQLDHVQQVADALADDVGVPRPGALWEQLSLIDMVRAGSALGPECWILRRPSFTAPSAPAVLARAKVQLQKLVMVADRFDDLLDPDVRPSRGELAAQLRAMATAPDTVPWIRSSGYRAAMRSYRAMRHGAGSSREVAERKLHALLCHLDEVAVFGAEPEFVETWGGQQLSLHAPLAEALAMSTWYHESRGATLALAPSAAAMVDAIWGASLEEWQRAAGRLRQGTTPDLGTTGDRVKAVWAVLAPGVGPDPARSSATDVAGFFRRWPEVVPPLADLLRGSEADLWGSTLSTILDLLTRWEEAAEGERAAEGDARWIRELGFPVLHPRAPLATIRDVVTALGVLQHSRLPSEWLEGIVGGAQVRRERLQEAAAVARPLTESLMAALAAFESAAGFDPSVWAPETVSLADVPFERLAERLGRALDHEPALQGWCERHVAIRAAEQAGFAALVGLVTGGIVPAALSADAYEAAVLIGVGRQALNDPVMHAAFGEYLDPTRLRFQDVDRHVIEVTRALIRARLGGRSPVPEYHSVGEPTDEALPAHEAWQRRRFIPIRSLFAQAGRAIRNLKPCYLMSPVAVAQYIGREEPPFDLVIMDEASQLRPEDALGAIARARQLVVVGDTQQLPPTTFLDALQDNAAAIDEPETPVDPGVAPVPPVADETFLERAESILDVAREKFPHRRLLYHYRSRHPTLIAFSNRTFYQNRLVLVPTATAERVGVGVVFHRVKGTWANQLNPPEATAIVAAARVHAEKHPEQSLMIVAMNLEQADLIEDLLLKLERVDEVWAWYIHYWAHRRDTDEQEPFVVKNLENVQGDERDRVMVSVTYGPGFGPLVTRGGERRLNVLCTRARLLLDLFCSFEPEDLRLEPSSSPGLELLYQYLRYARDGVWTLGREPDSEVGITIGDALRSRDVQVISPVGVTGMARERFGRTSHA